VTGVTARSNPARTIQVSRQHEPALGATVAPFMLTLRTSDHDILLLTRRQERFTAIATLLQRVWPELLLERVLSAPQAARLALRGHARLMLIDAELGPDGSVGLAHHLARWRPDLPVLVLTDGPPVSLALGLARQAAWDSLDDELCRCLALPSGDQGLGLDG
jgi:hypothetical protein